MKLNVFCDGSYHSNINIAIIAVVIKDRNTKNIITTFSEKIECYGSNNAELEALFKAFRCLNSMQQDGQIPYKSDIRIMGDNQHLIDAMNKQIEMKDIRQFIPIVVYEAYKTLAVNNDVKIKWVRRGRNKDADRAARLKNYIRNQHDTL